MLKAGFEPELCYLSCFVLSVPDRFPPLMCSKGGWFYTHYESWERLSWQKETFNTYNKVQDWIRGCSASVAVMWKRGHCDFALLFILHAVNPTIHFQFNIAGIAKGKKELDWFIIRWTWKLWWCVAFLSTLKHCDLSLCVLLNSLLLHLPGRCSSSENRTKASWWGRKGPG